MMIGNDDPYTPLARRREKARQYLAGAQFHVDEGGDGKKLLVKLAPALRFERSSPPFRDVPDGDDQRRSEPRSGREKRRGIARKMIHTQLQKIDFTRTQRKCALERTGGMNRADDLRPVQQRSVFLSGAHLDCTRN